MSAVVLTAREQVKEAIRTAIAAEELPAEPIPAFTMEVPGDRSHSDLASNAAVGKSLSPVSPQNC